MLLPITLRRRELGAAVRTIHEGSRQMLERYVKLEPIIASDEDRPASPP